MRRRVRWIRPACIATLLVLAPFQWSSGCGGERTGIEILFRSADAVSSFVELTILCLAAVWVAPRAVAWLRLLVELVSAAAFGIMTFVIGLQIGALDKPRPAGAVVFGALVTGTVTALWRVGEAVHDLVRAWSARRKAGGG